MQPGSVMYKKKTHCDWLEALSIDNDTLTLFEVIYPGRGNGAVVATAGGIRENLLIRCVAKVPPSAAVSPGAAQAIQTADRVRRPIMISFFCCRGSGGHARLAKADDPPRPLHRCLSPQNTSLSIRGHAAAGRGRPCPSARAESAGFRGAVAAKPSIPDDLARGVPTVAS